MIERCLCLSRLLQQRLRARWWAFRGARIGPKVNVGARCRLDHPSGVEISRRATLEDGVWLKLVSDHARLSIGEYSFLGRDTELDIAVEVSIGKNVLIAPRVFITDHSHLCRRGELITQQGCEARSLRIGDDVWIGTGVTVLSGVTVGNGAVIGAGAVVRKDVPADEVWAGVPARKIRDR